MEAALSSPMITKVGRGIVYLASALNIALLVLAIDTALDAKAGKLQAQQDLWVAVAIVLYGGAAALACLVTLVVGAVIGIRTRKQVSTLFYDRIFVLGVINCIAPLILLFGLRWS